MYLAIFKVDFNKDGLCVNNLVSVLQSLTGILGEANTTNDLSRFKHSISYKVCCWISSGETQERMWPVRKTAK